MSKVETILEEIKGLTLLEASDLVKKMEEAFGVSAAAATVVAAAAIQQRLPGREIQSGGDHHERPDAPLSAFLRYPQHLGCRDRQHGEIHRARQRGRRSRGENE